jgi:hypothetical protein
MNQRLSSIIVPIYKLFPLLPLVPAVLSASSIWRNGLTSDFVVGLFFWICWGGFFYFVTRNWRVVYLRDNTLVVYTLRKTIEIPASHVADVEASSWLSWNPRRITIKLKSDTGIGNEIVIVPRGFGYFAGTEAKRIRALLHLT